MKSILRNEKGQSLVEVIISLSIAIIVVLAFTSATISAVREAQFAKNQNQATRIAQRSLELVRAVRDQDNDINDTDNDPATGTMWSTLWSTNIGASGRCYNLNDNILSLRLRSDCNDNNDELIETIFRRKIRIADDGSNVNRKTIYIQVAWSDGKGDHKAEANTLLTEWQ